jgi:hypothetical protein
MAQMAAPINNHSQVSKLVVAEGPVLAPASCAGALDAFELPA